MASDTEADVEPRVWLIAGPTASGKSALALALAERVGGEIVNADALQIYRDLQVLSARPSATEAARVPHHLYGVADAADGWSAGRWLRAALPVLGEVRARGRTPIAVGGTGLYFAALTRGLADTPAISEAVRAQTQAAYDREGEAVARATLRQVDPAAEARILPGDRQRLVRALGVHAATGRPLSAWREGTRPALPAEAWRGLVLEPPRAALYAACDARLAAMVAGGAVEEAARLDARGLDPTLPALKAVGLRELAAAARGETPLAAAVEAAARETRRYAKRQSTWFRNQFAGWPRLAAPDPDVALAALLAGSAPRV